MNIDELKPWLDKQETYPDHITTMPVDALNALLDREVRPATAGDPLPPLWHWMYFLPIVRQSQVGPDGHPLRGGFLPPVKLPRRMIVGGRLDYTDSVRVGDPVTRHARIQSIEHKRGRTGDLVFVTVRNEFTTPRGVAFVEEQDIVYRDFPPPGADPNPNAQPAPASHLWNQTFTPDPVIMFKFSALTFNGHRIHYDYPYVTQIEGYPGLVFHAPLIAILLADLVRQHLPKRRIQRLIYRAVSPTFDTAPFYLCGMPEDNKHVSLWSKSVEGRLTMKVDVWLD